jgi:glucose-1-phosphate thymidylyltransferase
MLTVDGRPLLDYVLRALAEAGVNQVCLVTHYLAEQIETYVGDGTAWGVRASFRRQPSLGGTAQALQTAVGFIETVSFVVAADYALPPAYLLELKSAYLRDGTDLAVSLKHLTPRELSRRSSIRFDDHGRILEIVEKPDLGTAPSPVGASLMYIVPTGISRYLEQLKPSSRGEYELPTVINQMLLDGYGITGQLQPAPMEWRPDLGKTL